MADAPTDRLPVKLTYAAIGAGSTPLWTAYEAGIIARNGLDADLNMIRGSGPVTKALLSGEVHFGNVASPDPVEISITGDRDLVFLTGGLNYMVQSLVVRPEITTAEQLKGKRLGGRRDLDRPSGRIFEDLLLENLFGRLGLDHETDIVHVDIKDQPDTLAKLETGEIDAGVFSPPWQFEARKRGFPIMVDSHDIMLDFQLGGIVASKALVEAEPELVRRVVKAYVEGVHHYKRHPEDVVKVMAKYSNITDREIALICHKHYDGYFKPKPYPSEKGIQTVIDQMAKVVPAAKGVKAERFIDRRWLDELDGYIDDLYEREPV